MKFIKIICSFCLLCTSAIATAAGIEVVSPDGLLKMSLRFSDPEQNKGELCYDISYSGRPVILESRLGIGRWTDGFELQETVSRYQDETWKPVYGERALIRDRFNETVLVLSNYMNLEVRAYDEGIAFRYVFPENPDHGGSYIIIDEEMTTFAVPEGTYCWFSEYAQATYEYLPVRDWPGESDRPLTLRLPNGLYASLCEAAMIDYSRTKFRVDRGESDLIRCSMYGRVEEIAPFQSPWRVVMVAEKSKDLLANNDIILNLNPPCAIEETDWIRPGKVMRSMLSTRAAMELIDFAADHNIEYIHFDSGWYGPEIRSSSDPRQPHPNVDIPAIVEYGKSKGVGLWLYVNQRALSRYLDSMLPVFRDWGVAGIKFGFVHVGSQYWTNWLHEAVRKCADHRLMVDIHDEYRPTGYSRTYPNLLTQEGIRGNEEFPSADINATHPFTRFISGAADYTICYYHRRELKENLPPNARSLVNTACHQMALSVIFYSPLQYMYWYDSLADHHGEPETEFFDRLHTVWDDTKVLDGQIGENITLARKKDGEWFVGAITNTQGRRISVELDFLDSGKNYGATIYTDDPSVPTRTHVAIKKRNVGYGNTLTLDLLPSGGCAMIISER